MNAESVAADDHRSMQEAAAGAEDIIGVADEMAAIFGPPSGRDPADLPRSRAIVPVLAPRRRGSWFMIAALAGVTLVAACAAIFWASQRPDPTVARIAPPASARSTAIRPASPPPAPARTASTAPVGPPPAPARTVAIVPAGPPLSRPFASAATRTPVVVPAHSRREAVTHRVVAARIVPEAGTRAERRRAEHAGGDRRARLARRCARSDDYRLRAWCLQPALSSADHRLRAAYERAVARGADRNALVYYRREWIWLQRRAARRPDEALRDMTALADDLSRLDR